MATQKCFILKVRRKEIQDLNGKEEQATCSMEDWNAHFLLSTAFIKIVMSDHKLICIKSVGPEGKLNLVHL